MCHLVTGGQGGEGGEVLGPPDGHEEEPGRGLVHGLRRGSGGGASLLPAPSAGLVQPGQLGRVRGSAGAAAAVWTRCLVEGGHLTVVQVTWVLGVAAVIVLQSHLRVCVGTRVRETGPGLRHAARGTRRGCRGQHGEERGRAVSGAGPGRTCGRSGRRQHGGQWFAVLGGHQGAGGG